MVPRWYLAIAELELPVSAFEGAAASSVYGSNEAKWGPKLAIDGVISESNQGYWHSDSNGRHEWIQVFLP